VSLVLGINHPSLPYSIPRRLLTLVRSDTQLLESDYAYCSILVEFRDISTRAASGTFNIDTSSALLNQSHFDERSNAAKGQALALFSLNSPLLNACDGLSELAMYWEPLSKDQPSAMEYLAAASLFAGSGFIRLTKPSSDVVDIQAISGFIMKKKKSYGTARQILIGCIDEVKARYGITSFEYGVAVAELVNCCNILQDEDDAKQWATAALTSRRTHMLTYRSDWFYLSVAYVDSFIGRAEYGMAVPKLQEIMDNPFVPSVITMIAALRMAKVQSRLQIGREKAFEIDSPLSIAATKFDQVSDILKLEFLEEVASSISLFMDKDIEKTGRPGEMIARINDILRSQKTSLLRTESSQLYLDMQKRYSQRMLESDRLSPIPPSALSELDDETQTQPAANNDIVSSDFAKTPVVGQSKSQEPVKSLYTGSKTNKEIEKAIAIDRKRRSREIRVLVLGMSSQNAKCR
jgi:hypothetical protein